MPSRRSRFRGRSKSRASRGPRSSSRSKAKPMRQNVNSATASPSPCEDHVNVKPAGWLDRVTSYDRRISRWVHNQGFRMFLYLCLRTLEFSGNGICLIPEAAATYLLPKAKLTPEVRMFFFNLLGAFIVDLVIVTLIKNHARRAQHSHCPSHTITAEVDQCSFPGSHSTRALMVVTFFTMYLPMWKDQAVNVWMPFLTRVLSNEVDILDEGVHMLANLLVSIIAWLVFSWAVATTSSRIILGRHFFFDVLIGCVVGILESTLYNNFLVIPNMVSEGVHNYIVSMFGNIEDRIRKFFTNGIFYVENLVMR